MVTSAPFTQAFQAPVLPPDETHDERHLNRVNAEISRLEKYLINLTAQEQDALQRVLNLQKMEAEIAPKYAAMEEEARAASQVRLQKLAQAEQAAARKVRALEESWEKGEAVRLSETEEIILNQSLRKLKSEILIRQNESKDAEELCQLSRNELTQARHSQETFLSSLNQQKSAAEQELAKASSALSLLQEQIATAGQRLPELETGTREAEANLKDLSAACLTKQSELETLASRTSQAEAQLHDLSAACAAKQTALEALTAEAGQAQTKLQEATAALASSDGSSQLLRDQEQAATNLLSELERTATGRKREIAQLDLDYQKAAATLVAMKQSLAELQSQNAEPVSPASATAAGPTQARLQEIVSEVIKIVDITDTAQTYIRTLAGCKVSHGQFKLLRQSLISLLGQMNVEEITLEPGTPVDSALRRRIRIARHTGGEASAVIESILTSGFAHAGSTGEEAIIRKPEVTLIGPVA